MISTRWLRPGYRDGLFTCAILVAVAIVYWPVSRASFVWDDKLCFHDAAWLRYGDEWTHYLFRDFCQWVNYFRPLGVGLLTLEVRLFDVEPGAMHIVSLGIHLANTLLVGLLARRLVAGEATTRSTGAIYASMALFGFHPANVEPVAWIACQFDLAATFFILLALLANTMDKSRRWLRATAVGTCFFLGACSKESGTALPPLLLALDLMIHMPAAPGWPARLRATFHDQWRVYAALLTAGIAYLLLRHWALGVLVKPLGAVSFFSLAHLQEICRIYVSYLRVIVWPFSGLGPIHIHDPGEFASIGTTAVVFDLIAFAVVAGGLGAFLRAKPVGGLIAVATAALLPVLHIVPVAYDASLYHERYAMPALAALCALLPLSLARTATQRHRQAVARAGWAAFALWVAFAILNVRVTVPLWSNDVTLWKWALLTNPDSIIAKDHLLTAYMNENDHAHAHAVAKSVIESGQRCASCLLNAANLAISEKDISAANAALEAIGSDRQFLYDAELLRMYIFARGEVLELQGNLPDAELAFREASRMEPLDPVVKHSLALLLVRQGKIDEARTVEKAALALFVPEERAERSGEFEAELAGSPSPDASRR